MGSTPAGANFRPDVQTRLMDADLKKLRKLTRFMQSQGVLSVKTSEIEVHLSPAAIFHKEAATSADSSDSVQAESPFTEADALFWSVPGLIPGEESH